MLELTSILWSECCRSWQGHRSHPCPQGRPLPSVGAVGADGSTQIGNREISLYVGSVKLTFLRFFLVFGQLVVVLAGAALEKSLSSLVGKGHIQ